MTALTTPSLANTDEKWILAVSVNGLDTGETIIAITKANGKLYVPQTLLTRWHIALSTTPAFQLDSQNYYALNDLALVYRINTKTQTLAIDAPATRFLPSTVTQKARRASVPQMPSAGGFLNYDIVSSWANNIDTQGALLEAGLFGKGLVFTSQNLFKRQNSVIENTRLASALTVDQPSTQTSLRLGDSINRSGAWGRSVRFGGIQWATNFALQPDFISFPLPVFKGETALPSTVDVFINNARTYNTDINAGAFSLNQIPVMSGLGEARLVVTDLLGRQQIITQPFYTANTLLRTGLNDFSFELGKIRQNYGVISNDYADTFASGTIRRGFSDTLTCELHGEAMSQQQALGISATKLISSFGILNASLATSHNNNGNGTLVALGFVRQTQQISFGTRTQLTSTAFNQIGYSSIFTPPIEQSSAFISFNLGKYGNAGFNYIHQRNRTSSTNNLIATNYSKSLTKDTYLNISAFKNLDGLQDYALNVSLTFNLGDRKTASANLFTGSNGNQASYANLQQSLPTGTGYGYRVLTGEDNSNARFEAGLNLQNDYGTYGIEAGHGITGNAYRVSASGGVGILAGSTYATRRIDDSFAVVSVPTFAGVRVYQENRPIGTTDANGKLFITRLVPYARNRIQINQNDLPITTDVEAVEIEAIPYFRSGYLVEFPVHTSRNQLFRLIDENQHPIPAGSQLTLANNPHQFPVGFDGEAYISGLDINNHITSKLPNGQLCEFDLTHDDGASKEGKLVTKICVPVLQEAK